MILLTLARFAALVPFGLCSVAFSLQSLQSNRLALLLRLLSDGRLLPSFFGFSEFLPSFGSSPRFLNARQLRSSPFDLQLCCCFAVAVAVAVAGVVSPFRSCCFAALAAVAIGPELLLILNSDNSIERTGQQQPVPLLPFRCRCPC